MGDTTFSLDSGLKGQRVIVTGAGGGIGGAVTRLATQAGIDVVATDADEARLRATVDALEGPGRALAIPLDLGDTPAIKRFVDEAADALGGLDGLVHVAATIIRQYDINEVTDETFDRQVAVNQRATFFIIRDACEHIVAQGGSGAVVTFSSVGAFTGGISGSWVYSSTKGAVIALTRGLSRRYGPQSIRVNAIAPGAVETSMLRAGVPESDNDHIKSLVPLGRVAEPEELASVCLFLISDAASYINGVTLDVDGGWMTR